MNEVRLNIAGVIILLRSVYQRGAVLHAGKERLDEMFERNFLCKKKAPADIVIDVTVDRRMPAVDGGRDLFVTSLQDGGAERWRLRRKGSSFVYLGAGADKTRLVVINKDFTAARAWVKPLAGLAMTWMIYDLYDFLQILLMHYLARHNKGIIVHAAAVDNNGSGLLFCGQSGRGKSTISRFWHSCGKARVLSDERVAVRRKGSGFSIYRTPWSGDFSAYMKDPAAPVRLKDIFFLKHAPRNTMTRVGGKKSFELLYPSLVLPFWSRELLNRIIDLSQDMVRTVPCYCLGFVKKPSIVGFIRRSGRGCG